MKVSEVLTKYPKLIKVLKDSGIHSRKDINNIEVFHPKVTHQLHFLGKREYQLNNMEFKIFVKDNLLTVKTSDDFRTVESSWREEI